MTTTDIENERLMVIQAMQANPLFSNVDKYTVGAIARMAINGYIQRELKPVSIEDIRKRLHKREETFSDQQIVMILDAAGVPYVE